MTELLVVYNPVLSRTLDPYTIPQDMPVNDDLLFAISSDNNYSYRSDDNYNWRADGGVSSIRSRSKTIKLDLYEEIDIPINFTIYDIREPEKKKTSYTKIIRIPGTKNNNLVFNHVYEISGNSRVNPNLRMSVIVLNDGIQVLKGNLQLKDIIKTNNKDIEYECIITGNLTSLFADLGNSKLTDLDFSEYSHFWTKENVQNSWHGDIKKNGVDYSNLTIGAATHFTSVERDADTNRVKFTTTWAHGYVVGDWVRVVPNTDAKDYFLIGDYQVAERISTTKFTINYPFPSGLYDNSLGGDIYKCSSNGEGYVYPMISWGDDSIIPGSGQAKFPTTSFVMSFFVKEIIDKIFESVNSKYECDFFETEAFKRLIVSQKRTNELATDQKESREFKVANTVEHDLQITGQGTYNSGNFGADAPRSYPENTLQFVPYSFTSSIADSDGYLYNGTEGSIPYDYSIKKWKVTDSGQYDINFSIILQAHTSISDYTAQGVYDPPVSEVNPTLRYFWGAYDGRQQNFKDIPDVYLTAKLFKKSAGLISVVDEKTVHLMTTDGVLDTPTKTTYKQWVWNEKDLVFNITDQFLNKDDEIWIQVAYRSTLMNDTFGIFIQTEGEPGDRGGYTWTRTGYRGDTRIKTKGVQFFANKASEKIIEGTEVYPKSFLPTTTTKDFLLGIIKMFNLHIESDKSIEKYYYIEPRDDFYEDGSNGASDYLDWTDKVDTSSMQITPIGELTAKYYNFNYKAENDYWNKRYKDEVNEGYGDYLKTIENDFLTNEVKIEIPFGSSVMINSPASTNIVIPQIVAKTDNVPKVTKSNAKILIWGGIRPTTIDSLAKKWNLLETVVSTTTENSNLYSYYPYAGTVDSPLDPLIDLNWFYTEYVYWNRARWTNNNLYNRYWRRFIEEIADPDSKVIKCYLNLTNKDINELDFRKIYLIDNNYLRLQKIIDYTGKGLTKCEFLKLKATSKFVQRSIGIGETFDDIENNWKVLTTEVSDTPPLRYSGRSVISNYSASQLSAVYDSNINGANNVLLSNSTNVSIQGNENFVGSDSKNISINGDGVFVSGGLRNVNVIGTNKIRVTESDVTYINGIRYKNGVAISKVNVINGGLNKVLDKSASNTTINLIDGGEDVVINYGSSTYENIINSGMDEILPDVPIYGVSTLNSPDPATNYSGPAIRDITNVSLPDSILARVDPIPYSDQ